METNRIYTDKQPSFYFLQQSSSLCWRLLTISLGGVEGALGYGQPEMRCWVLSPQVPATSCYSTPARGWQKRQPCWSLGFFTQSGSSSACSFSIRWPEALQTDSPSGSGEMMAQATFASWSRWRPFKVSGSSHAKTDLACSLGSWFFFPFTFLPPSIFTLPPLSSFLLLLFFLLPFLFFFHFPLYCPPPPRNV